MIEYVWAEGAKYCALLVVFLGGGGGNGLGRRPTGLCRERK